jgi:hypothetical protein
MNEKKTQIQGENDSKDIMLFNIYLRKGAHGGQKSRGKWWWQKINLIDLKNNGFCRKES